jgi:hypothetical protein
MLLSGCNGNIYTKKLNQGTLSEELSKGKIKGIIHYPQKLFYEISVTSIRKNEKGEVVGWAVDTPSPDPSKNTHCEPITQFKLVTRSDFDDPRNTYYDSAWLETYKFNATLSPDGTTLIAIGSESSPDRGQTILNLTSAAANVAKSGIVPLLQLSNYPPCNDGSVVVNIVDYKTGKEAIKKGDLESLKTH